MLHVGLNLSRKRVDVCLISDQGELVDELAAPFDGDGLCRLPELACRPRDERFARDAALAHPRRAGSGNARGVQLSRLKQPLR